MTPREQFEVEVKPVLAQLLNAIEKAQMGVVVVITVPDGEGTAGQTLAIRGSSSRAKPNMMGNLWAQIEAFLTQRTGPPILQRMIRKDRDE